ncbi:MULTISPECIES: hypothetical protein [unclassified Aureimonas]|uniref:hypothetical protein n=1 Tax=unclassified Aureimonas TaxID=2615206 RepID=UPI0006FFE5F8|nr:MULTISPECIES: hypothetical protein [unclassified Aureimonas]KQT60038.1 hypothetical protein ASG62_24265 [Aureimonas sp. Leaf427]KQT79582.1 hypothetical protein ASG54_08440 [Aureimonas sp. Leaf460]
MDGGAGVPDKETSSSRRRATLPRALQDARALRACLDALSAETCVELTGQAMPEVAKAMTTTPRLAARLAARAVRQWHLPEPRLEAHGMDMPDAVVLRRVGLAAVLRRFGPVIERARLETFLTIYDSGDMRFALAHAATAPDVVLEGCKGDPVLEAARQIVQPLLDPLSDLVAAWAGDRRPAGDAGRRLFDLARRSTQAGPP